MERIKSGEKFTVTKLQATLKFFFPPPIKLKKEATRYTSRALLTAFQQEKNRTNQKGKKKWATHLEEEHLGL